MNWWNNISIKLLRKKRISSVRIKKFETCDRPDATREAATAAENENMKKATCAGDLSILQPKSRTICPKLTSECFTLNANAKVAAITASNGRSEAIDCSINPAFNKHFSNLYKIIA